MSDRLQIIPQKQGTRTALHARERGFTLIELLIVTAIIAMVSTIGVPAVFRAVQKKDPLTQGVSDVMEACAQARAAAIMRCTPMVVKFLPYEYTFKVEAMPQDINAAMSWNNQIAQRHQNAASNDSGMKYAPYTKSTYTLHEDLGLDMLDVNMTEHKDDDVVISRFFPNGTADLLTVVISYEGEFRRITVDMVTGLASFDNLNEIATPKNPMRRRRGSISFQ